jgi:hypothetical protein
MFRELREANISASSTDALPQSATPKIMFNHLEDREREEGYIV